jgi:hypothetical protein
MAKFTSWEQKEAEMYMSLRSLQDKLAGMVRVPEGISLSELILFAIESLNFVSK